MHTVTITPEFLLCGRHSVKRLSQMIPLTCYQSPKRKELLLFQHHNWGEESWKGPGVKSLQAETQTKGETITYSIKVLAQPCWSLKGKNVYTGKPSRASGQAGLCRSNKCFLKASPWRSLPHSLPGQNAWSGKSGDLVTKRKDNESSRGHFTLMLLKQEKKIWASWSKGKFLDSSRQVKC